MKIAKNMFCALVLCVAIVAMMVGAHILGSKLAGYSPSLGTFTFGAVVAFLFLHCYHIAQQGETTNAEPSHINPAHEKERQAAKYTALSARKRYLEKLKQEILDAAAVKDPDMLDDYSLQCYQKYDKELFCVIEEMCGMKNNQNY